MKPFLPSLTLTHSHTRILRIYYSLQFSDIDRNHLNIGWLISFNHFWILWYFDKSNICVLRWLVGPFSFSINNRWVAWYASTRPRQNARHVLKMRVPIDLFSQYSVPVTNVVLLNNHNCIQSICILRKFQLDKRSRRAWELNAYKYAEQMCDPMYLIYNK